MEALELAGLTVQYGALRAVDGVDLRIERGEVRGLVGPNGSGKSTMLNAISGLTKISGGAAVLAGQDITGESPYALARRGVARTFQLVRLLAGLTVADNVYLGALTLGADGEAGGGSRLGGIVRGGAHARRVRARVEEAMERAGVAEFASLLADELPFGVQRRVEIARAIVGEPELLLLDEPAAGLSIGDLEDLGAVIQAEAARGCTVILVDHHLHFVVEHCPRTAVLNFGKLIFDGPSTGLTEDQAVKEAYVGT
jgi:ABC-type branched-subunit amino acid transport system ATPase component